MLERELLLLQVVLKIKNITRVIHGDFDLLTPKELGTQTLKYGRSTDNYDASEEIGMNFGTFTLFCRMLRINNCVSIKFSH